MFFLLVFRVSLFAAPPSQTKQKTALLTCSDDSLDVLALVGGGRLGQRDGDDVARLLAADRALDRAGVLLALDLDEPAEAGAADARVPALDELQLDLGRLADAARAHVRVELRQQRQRRAHRVKAVLAQQQRALLGRRHRHQLARREQRRLLRFVQLCSVVGGRWSEENSNH